ncbi:MAG: response regulator [Pirellulales bacterium]
MVKVLIVDDSAVDRRLAGGLLQRDGGITIAFAEDGLDAIAKIEAGEPDLVVTDLQMPRMDGLKLVTAMRLHHADVPVILMTAHGSEETAVEALAEGAASYVSKAQLADRLYETVRNVLAMASMDRSYERLIECSTKAEFVFYLESDPTLIDPLVDLVQQIVVSMGICDAPGRLRVGVALEQAVLNAMVRGNLEISFDQSSEWREHKTGSIDLERLQQRRSQSPYRDRKVYVHAKITRDEARFVVRDEGPGFDVAIAERATDAKALEKHSGRGLVLMHHFMDEVRFNETGNEVTMVKRRGSSPKHAGRPT